MASERSKVVNTGKPSEKFFLERMEANKAAVFRLRDAADLYGINKRKVASFGMPSDFIVVHPRCMFFAEVKSTHNKSSFSLDALEKSQKAAAARCTIANSGNKYRIYIHNMVTDTWYIMDGHEYVCLVKSGVKSVKWEALTPLKYWVP